LVEAFERHPDLTTFMLHTNCYHTPLTSLDENIRSQRDFHNLQIYSQLLDIIGYRFPSRYITDLKAKEIENNAASKRHAMVKKLQKKVVSFFLEEAFIRKVKVLVPFNFPLNILLPSIFKSQFRILPFNIDSEPISQGPLELESRNKLKTLRMFDEFERIVLKTLIWNMPRTFIEDFRPNLNRVLDRVSVHRIILISNSWIHGDEISKMFAAEQHEKGGMLVGIQHGGGYGTADNFSNRDLELDMSDKYYTWGWSNEKETSKIKVMPSMLVMKAKFEIKSKKDKMSILLVLNNLGRYFFRFNGGPKGPQMFAHFAWTERFLSRLSPDFQHLIKIRPYVWDYGLGIKDNLLAKFPKMSTDDLTTSFARSFKGSRVVVINHRSTTLLETLASDHPTILFWSPDLYEIRGDAEPFFELLRDAGVLHFTPEGAAKHLMDVYATIEDWWQSTDTQRARQTFVNRYAFSPDDSTERWVSELVGLARNPSAIHPS